MRLQPARSSAREPKGRLMITVNPWLESPHGKPLSERPNFTSRTVACPLMPLSSSSPAPVDAAVLLVLLPLASGSEAASQALTSSAIRSLQQRLWPIVRVLRIDEASHPAVVRSFGTPQLPACVLVRRGVELWRQQGLPADVAVATLLEVAQR